MRTFLLVSATLVASLAHSQGWESEARALRPQDTSTQAAAVLDDLEQRARAALDRIPRATSGVQADTQRGELRQRLGESLGHHKLPWPPNLQASTTGLIQQDGYRIEKIVFETLPATRVPAHLYVPDSLDGRAPAVLFYNGHWWQDSKSRPDFQAFCINMARMGFVVLSFDPFGQGERGVSSRDHRRTEALLVGLSQQGIAEYETRCALEYLLSRKEVDPDSIGITGASGGGYNTWITGALDDRISVAVPVVGTSDFFEQIHVTRELDWYHAAEHCHFVPGLINYANNHELLAMIAPRPLLIIAASEDQSFPVKGVREVHEYGQQLYSAFGASEKVGLFVDSTQGHGYQKAKREAAYGWFRRWLMNEGNGRPMPEPETTTLPFDSPELRCFPESRQEPAGPGIIEAVRRLSAELPPTKTPTSIEELMGGSPAEAPLTIGLNVHKLQRVVFEPQTGIEVPAYVIRPGPDGSMPATGVLVAVDDRGKEALASDPLVVEAERRGWMVWAIDPRGIGESAIEHRGWAFAVSLLLGENFVWRQGWEIRRIAEFATGPANRNVALYARGHNAALAATYAICSVEDGTLAWSVLRGGFVSYRQFIERPQSLLASFRLQPADERQRRTTGFDREIPHEYFPFGALESMDLPELIENARTRATLIEPINGDWLPMEPAEVPRALRPRVSTMEDFLKSDW